MRQQTEDELKIIRAFEKISEEELRKEQDKIRNKTSTAARDMQLYSQYTKELEAQKMEDEKERQKVANEILDEITRKRDEEKLKNSKARNDLLKVLFHCILLFKCFSIHLFISFVSLVLVQMR